MSAFLLVAKTEMRIRSELVEMSRGEFMRHANFCAFLAASVLEPVEKAALFEMGERWREFAQHAPAVVRATLEQVSKRKPRQLPGGV
jgi:hypothetical protein